MAPPNSAMSPIYRTIADRLAAGGIVILDGGIGSELQAVGYPENPKERPANYTWGSIAIHDAPDKLIEVHRRYAESGADVLETHTFALNRVWSAIQDGRIDLPGDSWKEMALESVRLVREGARRAGRDDVAVAFACRTQDWPADQQQKARDYEGYYEPLDSEGYLKPLADLLANADPASKPDVILMEIQSWIPEDLEFPDYQIFLETGIPLWISYRRTVGKLVGVAGETLIEDGDRFGLAARRFEQMGAAAVLVNCLPPGQVSGVGAWLRQFTKLPLGAYPNMGKYLEYEWDWSTCETPEQIVKLANGWAQEGIQIIGGCCGARPDHIRGLVEAFKSPAAV